MLKTLTNAGLARSSRQLLGSRTVRATCLSSSSWRGGKEERERSRLLVSSGVALGVVAVGLGLHRQKKVNAETSKSLPTIGERVANLPEYSKEQVSGHDDVSKRVWVTYKNGVYDITDFINQGEMPTMAEEIGAPRGSGARLRHLLPAHPPARLARLGRLLHALVLVPQL